MYSFNKNMSFKIVFILYLTLVTAEFNRKARIIGGEVTDIREFPHQVSLRLTSINKHGCAGAIISKWNILTAAHCLEELNGQFYKLKIYTASSSSWNIYGKFYKIARVHIHPGYLGLSTLEGSYVHDIAVITLQNSIEFNEYQNKIELPSRDIVVGDHAFFSGWGLTEYPSPMYSERLRKTNMTVISKTNCQDTHLMLIHNTQFCAFQKKEVGLCTGDSGGALVSDGKVIGIASFVLPCAKGIPDVFTNVYMYLNFIQSVIIN